jgi:hypothetical protein
MLGLPIILKRLKKLWCGITAMNYTDTTHYLFPVDSKPGVVNVLPWLNDAENTNAIADTDNIDKNVVPTSGDALVNLSDYSTNPSAALL